MPHTSITYDHKGKGKGWVGEWYCHSQVTQLAPGQYCGVAWINNVWIAGDGNLTVLPEEDGILEVRFPSNGIQEYWKRVDGKSLEILHQTQRKWEQYREERQLLSSSSSFSTPKAIRLVFSRIDILGLTWHWGLAIGDSIYEVTYNPHNIMVILGPNGVIATAAAEEVSADLLPQQQQQPSSSWKRVDGFITLEGETTYHSEEKIIQGCQEWVRTHPIYNVSGPNCQTFSEDLYTFLTGKNLDFAKFADMKRGGGPEKSANAVWLKEEKKPRF